MDAYGATCDVEEIGMADVRAFLGVRCVSVQEIKGKEQQRTSGDFRIIKDDEALNVEVKIEEKWTGNLFLETFSNRSREWYKDGWIYYCKADILLYYFLDVGILLSISLKQLQDWAVFEKDGMFDLPHVAQTKRKQRNATWGRIVPVEHLKKQEIQITEYSKNEQGIFIEVSSE